MASYVRAERDGRVGTVTIDRPDKLNALGSEVLEGLVDAFDGLEDATVVVLRTAGDRAFVAGADLGEFGGMDGVADFEAFLRLQAAANAAVEDHPAVVVAEVDALAYGGGFELALAADMIVASEAAEFGFPEVSRGLIPGGGGTQRLARIVGPNVAKELVTTGDPIDAAEAKRLGIVNRVAPPADLAAATDDLVDSVLENAPLAVADAAGVVDRGLDASLESALALERETVYKLFGTEDAAEGIAAFEEGREPEFTGE